MGKKLGWDMAFEAEKEWSPEEFRTQQTASAFHSSH